MNKPKEETAPKKVLIAWRSGLMQIHSKPPAGSLVVATGTTEELQQILRDHACYYEPDRAFIFPQMRYGMDQSQQVDALIEFCKAIGK